MSDDAHRRLAAAHRRTGQGDRRDALRRRRLRPRPAPRAARALDRGARAHPSDRQERRARRPRRRRRARRGRPPDSRRPAPTAPPSRSRATEVVFAGQPVALVVAETEAAAEDGAETVFVDYEPLAAVVDVEAAMEPGAPLARTRRGDGDEGGDLESIHAGVDHGQETTPSRRSSPATCSTASRARTATSPRRSPRATWSSRGRSGRRGCYQAYIEPQVCTAWLEPSGTLVVSTSTQGSFVTQQRARARVRPPARPHPRRSPSRSAARSAASSRSSSRSRRAPRSR